MQRYRFRLEAVLKVRRMREEACRNNLGKLMVERRNLVELTETLAKEIHHAYSAQETSLEQGMQARLAAFFPILVEGKDAHIKEVEGKISALDLRIEEVKKELTALRAELKAVENLREKDHGAWRKAYSKETDRKVEEMVQIWGESHKNREGA